MRSTRDRFGYTRRVFRDLFDAFSRDCAVRIARGEHLSPDEAAAFSRYLAARAHAGHALLGPFAGPDGDIDTVTGRCGHFPVGSAAR
jgi:hypothetical protein